MNRITGAVKPAAPSWTGDLWGGLAAMLVALPSAIAFGVLVYSALGSEFAGRGAMAGILGAAALGLIAPLVGRTGGLISTPCAPAAAVLSALVAGLLAGGQGAHISPDAVLPLLAGTALLSALLQVLYGAAGGGRLIKFIPYPVVSGYLSGVGVLIALGQIPKLFGLPKDVHWIEGMFSPGLWMWPGLVVGIVTILIVAMAQKLTTRIPGAILGLLGGVGAYFLLSAFIPALGTLKGNPLLIGPLQTSGGLWEGIIQQGRALMALDAASLKLLVVPSLTLSVLLSIDTLKTCVVLDAVTHSRHNSNRELVGQGAGNVASCLAGGMPGAGAMGPSIINIASGGRTSRAGVMEGTFVVLALVFLAPLIAWVPLGALAGIMMVIAFRMFDWSAFRLLKHPAGRLDFAVIAGVVITAVTVDLIAASGVGVGFAILLFIRDQIRGSVIRRKVYLNQVSSKTRRLPRERAILKARGDQGVFCELQGNLFFGTTDQLFSQLEPDLRTKKFILLDMRRVQSVDYTAAHLFEQMQAMLEERGGRLLFSGMPSALLDRRDFQHYLAQMGVVREGGGVIVSETLDGALEWMEDRILEAAGVHRKDDNRLLELKQFDLFRGSDEATLERLAGCVREASFAEGRRIFSEGDHGEELFLVRRGSVRILLPLEGGKFHHMATVGRGDFFGEVGFLDRGPRTAHAEAKTDTDVFILPRVRFDTEVRAEAVLGVHVFARLATAITHRLRETDQELRSLEER